MTDAVTVRYWAAAREAAGVDDDAVGPDEAAGDVGSVLDAVVARHAALAPVVAVSSVLRDGLVVDRAAPVSGGDVLEVLPPFAGG